MRKRLPGGDIAGLVTVRDAEPGDAPAVAAIGRVAFALVHEDLLGPAATAAVVEQTYSDDAVGRAIERCAAAPDAHYLVAERDRGIVGFLHYDSVGEQPELHHIYVHPDAKGQGVGSALVDGLHARIGPQSEYVLLVVAANQDAIGFYERHGLVVEGHADCMDAYRHHTGVALDVAAPAVDALMMRRPAVPET